MSDFSFKPGPGTARALRDALGCFGTGVTVVTTQTAKGPLAMTASSFSSVSLEPPLVLWCPAKASLRHADFVAADHYTIHILAQDQHDLAAHFARTGDDFDAIDWSRDDTGMPHLHGCLARFSCTRQQVYAAGDHSIIVGHVDQASYRPGTGLIFKRGEYGAFIGLT